jgi:hypothetical protein
MPVKKTREITGRGNASGERILSAPGMNRYLHYDVFTNEHFSGNHP